MSFKAFDMAEIEKAKEAYGEEARERWGESDAYKKEYEKDGRLQQRRLASAFIKGG